jgi:A/G-specific adenine glycosylase
VRRETRRSGLLTLRRALLAWYDREHRPLPWRRDRNSYRVWVAEVMLQQTRIAVVEPAYRRFLRALPTLSRLAAAAEDEVLSLWSGLGYYSRARALHRAARQLRATGRRAFPADMEEARRLPGVGAYTAAAVLSIAYDQPWAAVDGNVVRVLSRLRRLAAPDAKGEPQRSLADELLDRARPGDWNQALMELGETVCLPQAPRCPRCPLQRHCAAHRHGDIALYPEAKKRRAAENVDLDLLVLRDRAGRVLLERGRFPHLPHLWLPLFHAGDNDAEFANADCAGELRHAILHRNFRVRVFTRTAGAVALQRAVLTGTAERRIFTADQIGAIGRSSLLTKALRHGSSCPPST